MPAKASTLLRPQRRDRLRSGSSAAVEQRQAAARAAIATASAGCPRRSPAARRRDRAGARAARAAGRPGTRSRCRCRARPSTTTIDRSFASDGFWKPSSMTMTSAPAARAACAPATRSRATMVGATRASSSGSSPTSAARCALRIDPHRAGEPPAIAAAEHERPLAGLAAACCATAIAVGVLPAPPTVRLPTQMHRNAGRARRAAPCADAATAP